VSHLLDWHAVNLTFILGVFVGKVNAATVPRDDGQGFGKAWRSKTTAATSTPSFERFRGDSPSLNHRGLQLTTLDSRNISGV